MRNKLGQAICATGRNWPVVAFIVCALIVDCICSRLLTRASEPGQSILAGTVLGQLFLTAVIGGCWGRVWLHGLIAAVLLADLGFGLSALCSEYYDWRNYLQIFSFVLIMPSLILAASFPFLAMRQLCGWTLTNGDDPFVPRRRAGLEDLLSVVVVVASFLMIMRVLLASERGPADEALRILVRLCFFAGFSLVVAVPATWITFRVKSWFTRLVLWTSLAMVLILAIVLINLIADRSNLYAQLSNIFWINASASLTAAIGMATLLFNRTQLTRFPPKSHEFEPVEVGAADRRQLRLLAGGIFGLGVIASVSLAMVNLRQRQIDEQHDALHRQLAQQGGGIVTRDNDITELRLGMDATDGMLSDFLHCDKLERLSMANSQITDASLKKLKAFPLLRSLDLSGTKITDAALGQLDPQLTKLSLARTHVSLKAIVGFLENRKEPMAMELDLSEKGLSDDDLVRLSIPIQSPIITSEPVAPNQTKRAQVATQRVNSLNLSRNPITDASLVKLHQGNLGIGFGVGFFVLDISYTEIDGSGLQPLMARDLILDGTKITDATLLPLIKQAGTSSPHFFSVKDTAVTVAILPRTLSNLGFRLGNCGITEQDLTDFGPLNLQSLHLNGQEFTGRCFANSEIRVQTLDMSHSGITDETIKYLGNMAQMNHLSLAHTKLTDAALPVIAKLPAYEIDLRHTQFTAKGLLSTKFERSHRLILSRTQFSAVDVQKLNKRLFCVFDEEPINGQ